MGAASAAGFNGCALGSAGAEVVSIGITKVLLESADVTGEAKACGGCCSSLFDTGAL